VVTKKGVLAGKVKGGSNCNRHSSGGGVYCNPPFVSAKRLFPRISLLFKQRYPSHTPLSRHTSFLASNSLTTYLLSSAPTADHHPFSEAFLSLFPSPYAQNRSSFAVQSSNGCPLVVSSLSRTFPLFSPTARFTFRRPYEIRIPSCPHPFSVFTLPFFLSLLPAAFFLGHNKGKGRFLPPSFFFFLSLRDGYRSFPL